MKKFKGKLKRGLAIEYAIMLMILAVSFSALVLLTSTGSLLRVTSYDTYVEQKNQLDEIGTLICNYYELGSISDSTIKARAESYGYALDEYALTFSEQGAESTIRKSVQVLNGEGGDVILTIDFVPVITTELYKTTLTATDNATITTVTSSIRYNMLDSAGEKVSTIYKYITETTISDNNGSALATSQLTVAVTKYQDTSKDDNINVTYSVDGVETELNGDNTITYGNCTSTVSCTTNNNITTVTTTSSAGDTTYTTTSAINSAITSSDLCTTTAVNNSGTSISSETTSDKVVTYKLARYYYGA